jgi:hypothetical protein
VAWGEIPRATRRDQGRRRLSPFISGRDGDLELAPVIYADDLRKGFSFSADAD